MLYTVSRLETSPVVLFQLGGIQVKADLVKKVASQYGWKLFGIEDSFPKDMKPVGAILKDEPGSAVVDRLRELNCPIVQFGKSIGLKLADSHWIGPNLAEAGHLGAKFFADRGFKTLAFIGNKPWGAMEATYNRYKKHGEDLGCKCELFQITREMGDMEKPGDENVNLSHYRRIVNWLNGLEKPVGLLAYHDYLASKLSYYCTEFGLSVPGDVAILGIGNDEFLCEASCVPISSIETPWDEIWAEAFQRIKDCELGTQCPEKETHLPYRSIIERESTNVIAVDDLCVLRSLQYIWDNYHRNIGTTDVASVGKVHRSTLERKFRTSVGRTVNEEIRRKRLEEAERLLARDSRSVAEITKAVGFNSRNHFYAAFKKKHGITPMEFRAKSN